MPWYQNPAIIDKITNVMALFLFILEPIKSYLLTQPFDLFTFLGCIFSAVIGYFTSKSYQAGLQSKTYPTPTPNPTRD